MAKSGQRQAFVGLPLLRAIEQLPETVEVDGMTLRFTGEAGPASIVQGFSAYRARCECDGRGGWVDLSAASTTRTDMTLRIDGLRAARVEQLVIALRAAMTATPAKPESATDERIDVCRSA